MDPTQSIETTSGARARRSKIPLANPLLDDEMKQAALQALQTERFVLGESVFKFEEEFARYCGTKFAVSTASGTAALVLCMIAKGLRGGDVLTTPASFVASANSIVHAGAIPKFADINLDTYTIDPGNVRSSLGDKTKGVVPVHLYGYPAAMNELCEISSERGIPLIEDACQAHGASYDGRKVGSLGDAGCFSFFPSKNMTVAGDGGMAVTNDDSIAERVASLRDCGRAKGNKRVHRMLGFTERLNTVQAAIGRVQLKRLDTWNERRRQFASIYNGLLSDLDQVITPPSGHCIVQPAYHLYVIRCQRRDDLRTWLEHVGVESGVHYEDPIHLQPIYREMFGYMGGEFPNSEALCRNALSIPMHPNLTVDEVKFVSEAIHEFYQSTNPELGRK
jgi:perosamine synthetase